jgi:uncharacterized protein YcbX
VKAIEVTGLGITPVKGTRLRAVDSVRLGPGGVRENRRFFLINDKDEMVNATHLGGLNAIVSDYDDSNRHLSLEFPDGRLLAAEVLLGDELSTRFYGEPAPARLVSGEWSDAISEYVGQPLRLVEAGEDGEVDGGAVGAMTLISRASLRRLAEQADQSRVDVRRFRMLIEVDGVDAHEEDGWVGRTLRVGETILQGRGHVGRCVITNRDPDSGEITLQTLKILGRYRRDVETTEPVAFGIYGEVLQPGTIHVGDPVEVDD